jgi:hypothetical protein
MPVADKATQRAGDNSQQVIIDKFYAGITEERATEIADARARLAVEQYSAEAAPIAHERITRFDQKLVNKLSEAQLLNAFSDPAFLSLVQRAQINAASSERESDYDLLSRLLTERAKEGDRYVAASVQKAVEIVHSVDGAALVGLTVAWMTMVTRPNPPVVALGLAALENTYSSFRLDDLPTGSAWLDHLDTLGAVRLSPLGSFPKYSAFLTSNLPGYISAGFTAEQGATLNTQTADHFPGASFEFLKHEFNPELLRLPFANSHDMSEALKKNEQLTDEQREGILTIAKEHGSLENADEQYRPAFEEAIDAHTNLRRLRAWWDVIPAGFEITSCGRALAYVAAKQHHPLSHLAPFDQYLRT